MKYKSKSLKSNLVEKVQLLAFDGRPTWSSFLGLDTKSSKQRLWIKNHPAEVFLESTTGIELQTEFTRQLCVIRKISASIA